MDDLRAPDEPTEAELDAIRSQAAALSLPLMEHDIVQLAISMRRMAAAVEPLLSRSDAFAPDPTLFDPRR